jgi:PKD repeat protein
MPRILSLAAVLITFLLLHTDVQAQCPGCTMDLSCTTSPAFPTICPAQPPSATAGEAYQADFTFWMPASFSDPGSGITVSLEQMTVTGVTGLPFGLVFQTNEITGTYFPQQNEFGCARICGTPLIAGTYNVTISILATVVVSGFTTQVPEEFILVLEVLPGSGGNTSFSFTPTSGCGSATVAFQALIDGSPAPTSYLWDFGNGSSSTLAQPPAQLFDEAGEHVVSLQTTIGGYVLNSVTLTGVNNNWCGDVEEPNLFGCIGSPDLYFVLTNGNGGTWQSSTFDDTFTATWNNLGLLLSNPPYSISFYDEDVISQHDHLGTYNIPANGAGTYLINVAGGTTGNLVISLETQQVFFDTDTVVVHPLPEVVIMENGGLLCASDPGLTTYTWTLDGTSLSGNTACITPAGPGLYQVSATNSAGCQGTSPTYVVCPTISISQVGGLLVVESGHLSYAWSVNGATIPGATDPWLLPQSSGTYAVTVQAANNCVLTASTGIALGIDEAVASTHFVHVHPNPGNGSFTLEAVGLSGDRAQVELLDVAGRLVHAEQAPVHAGRVRHAVLVHAPAGTYMLRLLNEGRVRHARVVVQ